MTIHEANGRAAAGPSQPAVVISTTFSESTVWNPQRVTGARAALPIIDNTIRARSAPAQTTTMAAAIARQVVTLVGDRGDAELVLDALSEQLTKGFICG